MMSFMDNLLGRLALLAYFFLVKKYSNCSPSYVHWSIQLCHQHGTAVVVLFLVDTVKGWLTDDVKDPPRLMKWLNNLLLLAELVPACLARVPTLQLLASLSSAEY